MMKIGLFYGSSTGNTEDAAKRIAAVLRTVSGVSVDLFEISHKNIDKLPQYAKLILGVPTWDIGELQEDWARLLPFFQQLDLTGKQVALFGCGDQYGYPDTYQDAIGLMAQHCRDQGATLVGAWPTTGYDFTESQALEDGRFLGLALDDNQRKLTPSRIQTWVQQLIEEFALLVIVNYV